MRIAYARILLDFTSFDIFFVADSKRYIDGNEIFNYIGTKDRKLNKRDYNN